MNIKWEGKVRGEARVDYFHFICTKCGDSMSGRLGDDGGVETISVKCDKCGNADELKLYRTLPKSKRA